MDEKRIERKIVALMVSQPTTTIEGQREFKKKERQVMRYRRKEPRKWRDMTHELFSAVSRIDREVTSNATAEIDRFNKRFRG